MKFYRCKECHKIIAVADDELNIGQNNCNMEEVIPNTVEASKEKHIPVVTVEGNIVKVCVGEVSHSMLEEHHIAWIILQTKFGNQRVTLSPNHEPVAEFALLPGDEVIRAIAYCNIHGLWSNN